MPRLGLLTLTLAGLWAPLVAADVVPAFVDMRLGLQASGLDYTMDNGVETDQSFDVGARLDVSWTGCLGIDTWGGIVWGLGLNYGYNTDELDFAGSKRSMSLQTGTLDVFIGYAYAFSEGLQIEAYPVVGVGRAWMDLDDGDEKGHDRIWEYGIKGNLVWTLTNGFQAGITASILASETNVETEDPNGVTRDYDMNLGRFLVGGFIGVRL